MAQNSWRTELTNGAELCWRMVQNSTDEWCNFTDEWYRTALTNGAELNWRMVQNWADEWCRTALTNGAEQHWRMVQNWTDEWCRTALTNGAESTDKRCRSELANGAKLCCFSWSRVVLELTHRELRSSYGSWPVSEVRSIWKNTANN